MTEKRFNDALNAGRDEPYTLEQFRMLLTEHPENMEASDALETVEHMARYFMEVRLPEYDGDDGDADNIAARIRGNGAEAPAGIGVCAGASA